MIEKNETTQVKIIRLNTGEDIIGNCLFDDDEDNFLIDKPMKVIISRVTDHGKTMLIMMPWLPLEIVDENMASLNYGDVITMLNPKAQFVEYYNNTVDRYESLVGDSDLEEAFLDEDFSDEEDQEDNTIEEILEVVKEKKKNLIH
jgi:hypothetical protein